MQRAALRTRCVSHVNYPIHGHVLAIGGTQRFQERFILSLEGRQDVHALIKELGTDIKDQLYFSN